MTTRAELRTLVRNIARVETTDITDAVLDDFLDEGYKEVLSWRAWPWAYIVTPETVAMVASQSYVAIPAAVERIHSIVHVAQMYALQQVSITEWANVQNQVVGSSHPTHWARGGSRIMLWPTPATTDNLEIYHYGDPGFAAADATVPPWNQMFHEVLADWALTRLWEVEEDLEKSDNYRSRFETKLRRMADFYNTDMMTAPMIFGGGTNIGQRATNMPFLNDGAIGAS